MNNTLAEKLANDISTTVLSKLASGLRAPSQAGEITGDAGHAVGISTTPKPKPKPKPVNTQALSPQNTIAPVVSNSTATLTPPKPAARVGNKPNSPVPMGMTAQQATTIRSKGLKPRGFKQQDNGDWKYTPIQIITGRRG